MKTSFALAALGFVLFAAAPAQAGEEGCFLVVSEKGAKAKALKGVERFKSHPYCGGQKLGRIDALSPTAPHEVKVRWDYKRPFPAQVYYLIDPDAATAKDLKAVRVSMMRTDERDLVARFRVGKPDKVSGDNPGNYGPIWSADGRYVAYQQIGDEPRLMVYDTQSKENIEVSLELGGGGGGDDDLYSSGGPRIAQYDWHPLENRIFVKLKADKKVAYRPLLQAVINGSEAKTSLWNDIPKADSFKWSRDGRRIAYRPFGEKTKLWVRDLASGKDMVVCDNAYCRDVRFSPDSRHIVYWRTEVDEGERFQVTLSELPELPDGKVVSQIAKLGSASVEGAGGKKRKKASLAADFSPNGAYLAFFQSGEVKIITVQAALAGDATAGLTALKVDADSDKSDLVWLDNNNILFVRKKKGIFPISVTRRMMPDFKTRAVQPVAELSRVFELNYDLAVSPNGRQLAFSAFSKQQSIMLADLTRQEIPNLIKKLPETQQVPNLELLVTGADKPSTRLSWGEEVRVPISPRVTAVVKGTEVEKGKAADVTVRLCIEGAPCN